MPDGILTMSPLGDPTRTAIRHNPVLGLASTAALTALPADSREALRRVLMDLSASEAALAEHCWRRHKAPMAAYHKAVAVYAKHIARAVGRSVKGRQASGTAP